MIKTFGQRLIEGMRQAIAHKRGELPARTHVRDWVSPAPKATFTAKVRYVHQGRGKPRPYPVDDGA